MLKTVLPISVPVNVYFLYGSHICCLSQQQGSFYLKACLGKPLRIHLTSETSVLNDGKIPNSELRQHRLKGNHIRSKIFQNGKLRLVQFFQELDDLQGWSFCLNVRVFCGIEEPFLSGDFFVCLFMLIKMRVHLKILCNYYPFTHTNNISYRVSPISPANRLEET